MAGDAENENLYEMQGTPQWYAVQTRSNFEKRVANELTGIGLESYCPVFRETRRWTDRAKLIETPVFTGYVFVRFHDSCGRRLLVMKTNGAVRILGIGKEISSIPAQEIETIRRALGSGHQCGLHPHLQEGSLVRVRHGALKDVEGILVQVKNQARLVLSIHLLSRSVSVEISAADVEAVKPDRASSLVA